MRVRLALLAVVLCGLAGPAQAVTSGARRTVVDTIIVHAISGAIVAARGNDVNVIGPTLAVIGSTLAEPVEAPVDPSSGSGIVLSSGSGPSSGSGSISATRSETVPEEASEERGSRHEGSSALGTIRR